MASDVESLPESPYSLDVNLPVLASELDISWQDTEDLKASSCPEDFAAVRWNMHPAFKAERFAPKKLFQSLGLRLIGAHQTQLHPRRVLGSASSGLAQETVALITVAKRAHLKNLPNLIRSLDPKGAAALDAERIESVESVTSYDRLNLPSDYKEKVFLVSLYTFPGKNNEQSRAEFTAFASGCGFEVHPTFRLEKDGLYYVLLKGEKANLDAIADYSFVRSITVPQYIH